MRPLEHQRFNTTRMRNIKWESSVCQIISYFLNIPIKNDSFLLLLLQDFFFFLRFLFFFFPLKKCMKSAALHLKSQVWSQNKLYALPLFWQFS